MTKTLVCLALCLAPAARAQLIAEDFETGLDGWQVIERTGIAVVTSRAAAHRGDAGLRITDTETMFQDGHAGGLQQRFTEPGRSFYSRMWFRLVSRGASGGGTVVWNTVWERMPGAWSSAHGCSFDFRSQLFCGEQDVDATLVPTMDTTDAGVNVLGAGWKLLEGATLGRGTDAGTTVFAIDGVEVVRHTGLHANTTHFPAVQLGIVYNYDPGFVAVLDFDDVRFDPLPMASRLVVSSEPLVVGECGRVDVTLASSLPAPDGGPAVGLQAPHPLTLSVEGYFSDASCTTAATSPVLDGTALSLWVKPEASGPLELTVADAEGDLLPGRASALVSAATSASADRSYYHLSCSAAPGGWALLGLLAKKGTGYFFAQLRRRRATALRR